MAFFILFTLLYYVLVYTSIAIHQQLCAQGVCVSQRSVSHLLERYDELLAVWLSDTERLKAIASKQGRLILAIDGMQPSVGHEVLWVIRECLSGEILLAKTLLSSRNEDLAALLLEVNHTLDVPIVGVVSDGQQSIRKAVEVALPGIPHGLCHFHYLREASKVIYEADRHAKKELKKQVRGIRGIERSVSDSDDRRCTSHTWVLFSGSRLFNQRWSSANGCFWIKATGTLDLD